MESSDLLPARFSAGYRAYIRTDMLNAKAWDSEEKADARDSHVRFERQDVEIERGRAIEAPADETAGNRWAQGIVSQG